MPASPVQARSSTSHSKGGKWPISGSRKSAHTSWKKALTSVEKRTKKDSAVNQWAIETQGRRAMRV